MSEIVGERYIVPVPRDPFAARPSQANNDGRNVGMAMLDCHVTEYGCRQMPNELNNRAKWTVFSRASMLG